MKFQLNLLRHFQWHPVPVGYNINNRAEGHTSIRIDHYTDFIGAQKHLASPRIDGYLLFIYPVRCHGVVYVGNGHYLRQPMDLIAFKYGFFILFGLL